MRLARLGCIQARFWNLIVPSKREDNLSVGQQKARADSTESEDDGFPVFVIDNQDQQGIADQSMGTFEVQGQWSQNTNISSFLV